MIRTRSFVLALVFASSAWAGASPSAAAMPPPMQSLRDSLRTLARSSDANVGIAVEDLATGAITGYNLNRSMPAASTIKIPVMIEVFRRMARGRFTLGHVMHLRAEDRDYGSGDLAYAPIGTPITVKRLLGKMIDISDNTAANMLIRLVGRERINAAMQIYGCHHTYLRTAIRTDVSSVESNLRTTPLDMLTLLVRMARGKLVDAWSSHAMLEILAHQEIDTLLPEPLPDGTTIAHKTGSLHDVMADVGIVYEPGAPFAIAAMTSGLPDPQLGRDIVRQASLLSFNAMAQLAEVRATLGLPNRLAEIITPAAIPESPDVRYWTGQTLSVGSGG